MNKEQRALDLLKHFALQYLIDMKYKELFCTDDLHEVFDNMKFGNIQKVNEAKDILQKLIDERK